MTGEFDTIVQNLVVERGLVSSKQATECLEELGGEKNATPQGFLDTLVRRGYIRPVALDALRQQVSEVMLRSKAPDVLRQEELRLGQLLLSSGRLTPAQLAVCLAFQESQGHSARLGEILIKRGHLTFSELEVLVAQQRSRIPMICSQCGTRHGVAGYIADRPYSCKKCGGVLIRPHDTTTRRRRASVAIPEVAAKAMSNPKNAFGKYALIRELGRGGMGVVFQAWDTLLNRMVAIKILLAQQSIDEVERFYQEAQTAAALKHPNIVAIYEVDQNAARHYIAMEYIEGHPLGGALLPVRRACEIVRMVALAVDYAHSRGIIHRDLKPQNILLDAEDRPHVMDFGLAKALDADSSVTRAGTIIGTPSYMPPEQARGRLREVDKQSDVYSIGAILYDALTGRAPFRGETAMETLTLVCNHPPLPPSKVNSRVPRELDAIVRKTLEKRKEDRYPSAGTLARDLEAFLRGTTLTPRGSGARLLKRRSLWKSRIARLFGAILITALLLALFLQVK